MKFFLTIILLVSCVFSRTKERLRVIDTHLAWLYFPPAQTSSSSKNFSFPSTKKLKAQNEKIAKALLIKKEKFIQEIAEKKASGKTCDDYLSAGIIYAKNGLYQQALVYFQKALDNNSKRSDVYNAIANIYYLTKKLPKAITWYLKSLKYKKDDPATLLNLSFIYYETGEFKKAREVYLKAILIDPSLDQEKFKVILGE